MILADANLLIYAYDAASPRHEGARAWLEEALLGGELVLLPWASILAFIRITTNPRAFTAPFSIEEASEVISEWLAHPRVRVVGPTERHWEILGRLLTSGQARGPLVSDAHLAALAIEHGAELQTTDRDFTRFPGLRFRNPLAP